MKRLLTFAFALLLPLCGWAQYNSYANYASGTAPSYEGLWWNTAESGWGISVAHQGDILFAVWYTYDHDGTPIWLVMPDATLQHEGDMDMMDMGMMGMTRNAPSYTGMLYRSRGPAFSSATFDRNAVDVKPVGMATFLFTGNDSGVFAYTVDNFSASKRITRMVYSSAMTTCSIGGVQKGSNGVNYQDLWWRPDESGWGVNIAHQGDILFATWYTYDATGKGMWLVMSNTGKTGDGRYAGSVHRVTGPAFDSVAWDASKVRATEVGAATFTFNDASSGTFAYTVDGVTRSKAIQRFVYALPASVCN